MEITEDQAQKKEDKGETTIKPAAPVGGTSSIDRHVLLPSRPGALLPCLCDRVPSSLAYSI